MSLPLLMICAYKNFSAPDGPAPFPINQGSEILATPIHNSRGILLPVNSLQIPAFIKENPYVMDRIN